MTLDTFISPILTLPSLNKNTFALFVKYVVLLNLDEQYDGYAELLRLWQFV